MNWSTVHKIYFLGIGGIGMSALARYFMACGIHVYGYDKTKTLLTEQLIIEGAKIHFKDDIKAIPNDIDMIIYTPAIPESLQELKYLKQLDVPMHKRAAVLGMISENKKLIAVAGTHGKTTITSMIAHICKVADVNFAALIGGIPSNYNNNFIGNPDAELIIVEADEYDRSFLNLYPDIAVISSMDADHLDIYGTKDSIVNSFKLFANQIKKGGVLIAKNGLELSLKCTKHLRYDLSEVSDSYVKEISLNQGVYELRANILNVEIELELHYPGMHNVENAIAAALVCLQYGIEKDVIASALKTYTGVKRRFETIIKSNKLVFIDDYAHHPQELNACIGAVKEMYKGKKVLGIFQPHLYSRTRDFANEFAESLSKLDRVIVLDIYPARELPIKGIDASFILAKMKHDSKYYKPKEKLIDFIKTQEFDVILTLGAGDIDQLVNPIKDALI